MYRRRRPNVVLALALLVSLSVSLYWSMPASAAQSPNAMEAAHLQPPPEPPSAPPPGSGSQPGQPQEPSEPSADPDTSPPEEESISPSEGESTPPMPSYVPSEAEPLPSPSGGAGGVAMYQVSRATGLTISTDRGCGAIYNEGESIQFSVTGDWEVDEPNTDWWRYLEVWGSTNGAWWHQVIPGRWVEPRESVYRSAWIASPVGDERLYARFLDRYGMVLAEANCYYTSQEEVQPPSGSWIECGETLSGYVGAGQEEHWYFSGNSGRRVTISMYGDYDFDTYLELYGPNSNFLREHDDISSYNKDSWIRLTLPRNGTYTIVAHGYDYREGSYSLSMRCR